MTAPAADGVAQSRLVAVAAWDVAVLRGAVAVLAAVAARLPVWRMRVATLVLSLQEERTWSGPAASSAVHVAFELSAVAAAVDGAIEESLAALERLAGAARTAQELAAAAIRSGPPPALDGALASRARLVDLVGVLAPGATPPDADPALALAGEALEQAAAALAAAVAAREAVDRLDVHAGPVATFGNLAAALLPVGPVLLPPVPVTAGPAEAADWWAALSLGAQLTAVRSAPAAVGSLDGVPAWARDRANRLVLARALREPATPPYALSTARRLAARIAAEEAAGRQAQLHLLDLAGNRVVLALGDLDTAEAVAVLVPGVWNSPADDLDRLADDAADVAAAASAAGPALSVATVVWLGYRTPTTPVEIATRSRARAGGTSLAAALTGLSAARAVTGDPPPRTTVLAHSYGTVVVDEAADVPGRLPADALVLLGSPGLEDDARALEVPEVFDAAPAGDLVAGLGWFGRGTRAEGFGSTELPVEASMGHSDYYDPARPTLAAIGEVVAGTGSRNG